MKLPRKCAHVLRLLHISGCGTAVVTALSARCGRRLDVASDKCFEGFVPCRVERCSILGLHRAHPQDFETVTARHLVCPWCAGDLIKLPKRRAKCTRCDWRASIYKPKDQHPHA